MASPSFTTVLETVTLTTEQTLMSSTDIPNTTTVSNSNDLSGDAQQALHAIYAIIGCLGILGNSIVCTVFLLRRRAFNSVTNLLILNQSTIDLLDSIVFLILRFGPKYLPHNPLGEFLCRVWYNEYVMWSLFITSTLNLVFLSLERYFATCHPVNIASYSAKEYLKLVFLVYGLRALLIKAIGLPCRYLGPKMIGVVIQGGPVQLYRNS